MTIITIFILFLIAVRMTQGSSFGRFLQEIAINRPAIFLARLGAGHLILALLLLVSGMVLFHLLEVELLRILPWVLPDLVLWISTFEVVTWLDALAIICLMRSAARFRDVRFYLLRTVVYLRPLRFWVGRRRREKARAAIVEGGNEDSEDGPVWWPLFPAHRSA